MAPGKRGHVVGVLSPVIGGYYFGRVLAGIARALRADGHRVVAVQTYPADLEREQFPQRPPEGVAVGLDMVDGLIVVTSAVDRATLLRLQARGLPTVLISERVPGIAAPVVTPDNAGGTRAAVEHLLGHGHREIGFLGSLRQTDILERYEAYRATLIAHGIEPRPEWFYVAADNQEASGAEAGRLALAAGLPTTATLAATDRNAVGFMRVLQSEGLVLPADQALVGFDHSDGGARLRPRLASVDPHHDRVGELAATVLLSLIRGEQVVGQHLSRTTLVTRDSCGCVDARNGSLPGVLRGGTLPRKVERPEEPDVWQRLTEVASAVFDGSDTHHASGASVLDQWLRGVRRVLRSAASVAQRPSPEILAGLADTTRALRPHPEALEQLVPVLRAVEASVIEQVKKRRTDTLPATGPIPLVTGARAPGRAERVRAVAGACTDLLVALSAGCTQTMLARSGQLERTIVDQYELDLELLHADAQAIRSLRWLPRGHRGTATLALWTDASAEDPAAGDPASAVFPQGLSPAQGIPQTGFPVTAAGAEAAQPEVRELEIVGTTAASPQARSLVGARVPVTSFPPSAIATEGPGVTFVVPVTFGTSDHGLLMIGGSVDTHATSARDKFDHWAAMLAVALDREARLASLRRQREALAEAAERLRALALDLRAGAERHALVEDVALEGTWDWDIATGVVYYSRTWKALLCLADSEVGTGIEEWTGRVHPDDARAVQVAIASQLAGAATTLDLEHRMTTGDGREIWVRCRATTVTDDAGVRARMVGVLMDMSYARERRGILTA